MKWRTDEQVVTQRRPESGKGEGLADKDSQSQHLPGHLELIVGLPRSMERRFRLRQIPVQPVSQPSVKLARSFAFHPAAHAKESPSALKLSGS